MEAIATPGSGLGKRRSSGEQVSTVERATSMSPLVTWLPVFFPYHFSGVVGLLDGYGCSRGHNMGV